MRLFASRSFPLWMLVVLVTGCSVSPYQSRQAPVEDRPTRSEPAPEMTQENIPAEEPDSAVVMPLPDDRAASSPPPATPINPPAEIQQNPAVLALLSDADMARANGDFRSAQSSLQRAQRIAPRDPAVYYSLAETHMALEDYDLAEQVALKGVSVAQGNPYQSQRLWQLLAKIRLRAGDPEGARQAEQKAAQY